MNARIATGKALRRLIFLLLTGTIAAAGVPLWAQTGQFGIGFTGGFPQGDFKSSLDDNGFGINANLTFHLGRQMPFLAGVEFAYLIYGSESRRVPFSLTIPDVTVEVQTSNNIVQGHLFLRAQNPDGIIRPYADGLFGFNYLFTETKIKDEDRGNEPDEIASSTNLDDIALSYGFGGGVMFQVYMSEQKPEQIRKPTAILVDLRLRYLFGSEAEYLKKGGIERENGQVTIHPIRSKTDILTFTMGMTVAF